MRDDEMAALLRQMPPGGRDVLRRLMRAEQYERDEFSTATAARGGESARDLADLIDLASMNPEVRRRFARILGELEAQQT
jgi:hypothetical protein